VRVALDGDHVNRFGLVGVDIDCKSEVGRQVAADLMPGVAGIVASHHVPVFLHEEHAGTRRVRRDVMNAVADLRCRLGDLLRVESFVNRSPRRARVVAAKSTSGRDGDEDTVGIAGVQYDRVQAHSARARLPAWA